MEDAHDRYANIEVDYLLQKMEEYEGIVILATNFMKNMDNAFVRRMHFQVEFPFPDEEHRLKICKTIFPGEEPRDCDIDFEFLVSKFKIAGGNIKNIILSATFLNSREFRKDRQDIKTITSMGKKILGTATVKTCEEIR